MMSDNMVDVMMEIRKVDKEMAEFKQKGWKVQQELFVLEKNICHVKELQLKALTIIKTTEMKSQKTEEELKNLHVKYDEVVDYINKSIKITPIMDKSNQAKVVEKMRQQRDNLKKELLKAKAAKEDIAIKLTEVEMQVNIQKKKNLALLLRLKKSLEELLQEETTLINKLK